MGGSFLDFCWLWLSTSSLSWSPLWELFQAGGRRSWDLAGAWEVPPSIWAADGWAHGWNGALGFCGAHTPFPSHAPLAFSFLLLGEERLSLHPLFCASPRHPPSRLLSRAVCQHNTCASLCAFPSRSLLSALQSLQATGNEMRSFLLTRHTYYSLVASHPTEGDSLVSLPFSHTFQWTVNAGLLTLKSLCTSGEI